MTSSPDSVAVRPREAWVDNLRVLVIAGVIVGHTATGYVVDIADWHYDDERVATGVWSALLTLPAAVGALFALGPLFLLAGWFTARSLARRGPGGLARTRLLRLGVPLVAFVLVVNPLADYVGNLGDEGRPLVAYWSLDEAEVGVMWFVAALLAFCLGYAGLRWLRPAQKPSRELSPGALVVFAAVAIAAGSFAAWQVWPLPAETFLSVRWGAWPPGAVLFALGVYAAESERPDYLSAARSRRVGWVAAVALVALAGLFVRQARLGELDAMMRGDGWPTVAFAALNGVIAATGTLWVVGWLRSHWREHGRLLAKAARGSYATYVSHPLVLTTLMVLLGPVALVPEVKFVLVAAAAVPVCFTAGYALTRVPGLSRVL